MQAAWKFRRDVHEIECAQKRIVTSKVHVAYGTDCGMFPCSHGILEFQAMVAAGLRPLRALKATSAARGPATGRYRCVRARQGGRRRRHGRSPVADIAVMEKVDFVMRAGLVYRHRGFDIFRS